MFPTSMSLLRNNEERQARIASSASSRGLLLTVLGEFVRPHSGAAWTQTIIDAMAALDVSEKATRQILARMDDEGSLHRSRDGRRTRWHLTDSMQRLLNDGAERIYRHAVDVPEWDGRWSVLLASVPDDERADRHRLTVGLNWAGYGSLGQGTWISPWTDREADAARIVSEAGISRPTSFVAQLGALGDGAELIGRAWDLDALGAEYQAFADATEAVAELAADGEGALIETVHAVHRWRRFPLLDPQLPAELLPTDWPSQRAAEAFAAVRCTHGRRATNWWLDREARYG